jgi:hypothetical protein
VASPAGQETFISTRTIAAAAALPVLAIGGANSFGGDDGGLRLAWAGQLVTRQIVVHF